MALPKLVLTDIDGVWTDGGMLYSENGDELKKFNTSDSAGVLFCKLLNIPVGIITGENTQIVARRAAKLKISEVHVGIKDKFACVESILEKYKCTWSDVAYIGDDINDIKLLEKVGIAYTVNSAPEYIKSRVPNCTSKSGGEGAFREFVEDILKKEGQLEPALEMYLSGAHLNQ